LSVAPARIKGQLCSVYSRAQGEDPGGSAPSWERCLVVELEKPWTNDVIESKKFPAEVASALALAETQGYSVRLQCVVPDAEYSSPGHTRVMLFSRPPRPFARFLKRDYLVPSERVGELVRVLLDQSGELESLDGYREDSDGVREMLVCTHGTRDVCCPSFGYPIYRNLRHEYAPRLDGRLRVWRTSHLGGHRLAPNLVDLPEGRNWVRIGPDQLDTLVFRERPASDMRPFYRGWVGLDTPFEQVAEREVFMLEGWDLTALPVTSRMTSSGNGSRSAKVRIEFPEPHGAGAVAYDAVVELAGIVPSVTCLGEGIKEEIEQYTTTQLEKVR
jgi:hypothetical protein